MLAALSLSSPSALAQMRTSGKRRIVAQVRPEYPSLAQKMHLTGTVRLMATINPAGKVTNAEILGGSPVLAQAAADAVSKSKWESGTAETKEIVEVKFQPDTE